MKKLLSALSVLFLGALILTGCSKYATKYGESEIYEADVTKVSVNDDNEWVLKGKTDAPDGTKIVVTPSDPNSDSFGTVGSESKSGASWAVADEGSFTVVVDPIMIADSEKQGAKTKVLVFGITKYHKKWTTTTISKKLVKKAKEEINSKTLTISKSQEKYYESLDDDDDEDLEDDYDDDDFDTDGDTFDDEDIDTDVSYDETEGNKNEQSLSYGQLIKSDNFAGKSYHIGKGEVLQAEEEDGKTMLLVYINDDPDDLFMVMYDGKTDAIEDDYVELEGVLGDREDYDTDIGGSNTVPTMLATKIAVSGREE